jgi:PPIC-type PPIASE domain
MFRIVFVIAVFVGSALAQSTNPELLALESAARRLGLDKSPEFQDMMHRFEVKTLADLLRRRLEAESSVVSDAEIENYYHAKIAQFEEVKLRRLILPKRNFSISDAQKFEQEAERIAAELRERAVQGEGLDRLQREGYEALGVSGMPPTTEVGIRRRANLPTEVRDEIFSLNAGEVSQVEKEPYSFVIYKVESKRTLPLEQVRQEIAREVSKTKLDQALKAITVQIQTERKIIETTK